MANYPLRVDAGTDARYAFRPGTQDDAGTKTYPSLAGSTFTLRLYSEDLTVDTFTLAVDGGWVRVHLSDETTGSLRARRYTYAVDMTAPSGDITRILSGPIYVSTPGA